MTQKIEGVGKVKERKNRMRSTETIVNERGIERRIGIGTKIDIRENGKVEEIKRTLTLTIVVRGSIESIIERDRDREKEAIVNMEDRKDDIQQY